MNRQGRTPLWSSTEGRFLCGVEAQEKVYFIDTIYSQKGILSSAFDKLNTIARPRLNIDFYLLR